MGTKTRDYTGPGAKLLWTVIRDISTFVHNVFFAIPNPEEKSLCVMFEGWARLSLALKPCLGDNAGEK